MTTVHTGRSGPTGQSGRARVAAGRRHLVLALACLAFVFPFAIMLLTSFKTPADIFRFPPGLLPEEWVLDNYGGAVQAMPFLTYLANTLFLVATRVTGTVISCSLVAYSLAKLRWAGQRPMFILVLSTMMLPPQVTMVPVYLWWNQLGAVNTYWPLVVPYFLGVPFFIFLLRQFFLGVPDEYIDAARVDGASELRIFLRIVMPLARPAVATVAVFSFLWTWTDFFHPLIYLHDQGKYPLSVGLYNFFGENVVAWGPLMAACVLFTLPTIGVFAFAQRYFVSGISLGGLK